MTKSRLYTGTGDAGTTSLVGGTREEKQRAPRGIRHTRRILLATRMRTLRPKVQRRDQRTASERAEYALQSRRLSSLPKNTSPALKDG